MLTNEKMIKLGRVSMYVYLIHYPIIAWDEKIREFSNIKNNCTEKYCELIIVLLATFLISYILCKFENKHFNKI